MEEYTLNGLLTLPQSILCSDEVLGKCFAATIAEIPVEVYFPYFNDECAPSIGINNPLLPPSIAKTWKRGTAPLNWGHPVSYPKIDALVALVAFSISCCQTAEQEIAQIIYNDIDRWTNAFVHYCILETKQGVYHSKITSSRKIELELLGSDGYIPKSTTTTILAYFHQDSEALTIKQIEGAMAFASSQQSMKIEYEMLLTSYFAKMHDQNNLAIINACSAVEISLNNVIQQFADKKGINLKILTSKYRTLGQKFELLHWIDEIPPTIQTSKITEIRNRVAHNDGSTISDSETDTLIYEVEKCLAHYSPQYY